MADTTAPLLPARYRQTPEVPTPSAAEGRRATFAALGRLGAMFSADASTANEQRAAARKVEDAGFTAIGLPESGVVRDPFVHASVLLAATERVVLMSAVANIWARDAAASNNAAATLASAYPARYVLGLG